MLRHGVKEMILLININLNLEGMKDLSSRPSSLKKIQYSDARNYKIS